MRGEMPFGQVLLEAGVEQVCGPTAFFHLKEDEVMMAALGGRREGGEGLLYGRCNVISDGASRVIAEVVEILPHLLTED